MNEYAYKSKGDIGKSNEMYMAGGRGVYASKYRINICTDTDTYY